MLEINPRLECVLAGGTIMRSRCQRTTRAGARSCRFARCAWAITVAAALARAAPPSWRWTPRSRRRRPFGASICRPSPDTSEYRLRLGDPLARTILQSFITLPTCTTARTSCSVFRRHRDSVSRYRCLWMSRSFSDAPVPSGRGSTPRATPPPSRPSAGPAQAAAARASGRRRARW
jgi:hypothetical protein